MSTSFTIYCETCEVAGPKMRRHHQRGILMEKKSARFFPDSDPEKAELDWGAFLIEHEYHELLLQHEWERQMARLWQERAKAEAAAEARRPTHELLEDGSIAPIGGA